MSRKQFGAMVLLVMVMSFLGGLVSERWLGKWVQAQTPPVPALPKEIPAGIPIEFISAKEFRLVDQAGKMRGKFGMDEGKRPLLEFYDDDGTTRIEVGVSKKDTPHFRLMGKKGNVRAVFSMVDKEGQPRLMLLEKDGDPRLILDLLPDGRPLVSLYDKKKKERAQLGLSTTDDPALTLFDKDGVKRSQVFLKPDGSPALEHYDKSGKQVWKAP